MYEWSLALCATNYYGRTGELCLPCPLGADCAAKRADPVAQPGWFIVNGTGAAMCPPEPEFQMAVALLVMFGAYALQVWFVPVHVHTHALRRLPLVILHDVRMLRRRQVPSGAGDGSAGARPQGRDVQQDGRALTSNRCVGLMSVSVAVSSWHLYLVSITA